MQQTEVLKLNLIEGSDTVSPEPINENFRAVEEETQAIREEVKTVAASLGTGGKTCRIAWGSYTGNGTSGSSDPITISVDFYPMVVITGCENSAYTTAWPTTFIRGVNAGHRDSGDSYITVTWGENKVSWYAAQDYAQNNSNGYEYFYVVLGYSN